MKHVALLVVCVGLTLAGCTGCSGGGRLVEVYNNGPVGGPGPTPAGYYLWVGEDELPTMGQGWKAVDHATLTPEQKARIR